MLSNNARHSPEGYRYVGSMLNIAYITGFVRNPTENGFLVQQINNIALAVPVSISPGTRVPRERTAVTVTCHVYGNTREDGSRVCDIRVLDIKAPSVRSMPTWLAWVGVDESTGKLPTAGEVKSRNLPEGASPDDLSPFLDDGTLNMAVVGQINDTPDEQEDILRAIIEATKGHLDTRLGENSNAVMLAGFVEAAALVRGNEHQVDYLGILLRQHKDSSKSIPVRLYSHPGVLQQYLKSITIGVPVKIVGGQVRTKLVLSEDGKEIKDKIVYIRCNDLKTVESGVDIRMLPSWLHEIKDRVLKEKNQRKAVAMEARSTPALRTVTMEARPAPASNDFEVIEDL
jgi:hypothetical protein